MAANNYVLGSEYEVAPGKTAVWAGKKGWVSPEAYRASKGQSQDDFNTHTQLMDRLYSADKASAPWDATGLFAGIERDKKIGGTAGFDLDKSLDPVRANAFIQNLQTMREHSPTGGAVGNVTEKEGEKIQGTDAILDVGQSRPQFREELGQLRKTYGQRVPGLTVQNPIDLATVNDASEIPQGAYFRAKDGKVYQNRKGAGEARDNPTYRRQLEAAQQFRGTRSPRGGAGNPLVPQDEAAYNAMPSGSYYIHPDGDVRRKK